MTLSVPSASLRLFAGAAALAALSGCYTYSSFQSARMLEPKDISVTPSFTFNTFQDDGEWDRIANQFGGQVAVGIHPRLGASARYERIGLTNESDGDITSDDDFDYNYAELGLKLGVLPDRLALYVPVGLFYGENIEEEEAWQMHPTLLATLPAGPRVDLNASAQMQIFFQEDMDNLIALDLGAGVHATPKVTLMPEVGMLFNPGEEGFFFSYGLGLAFRFGSKG